MISQQTIQQILSRIDIIEIVGGFIKLKKRGANYLGLCPFHGEKTPSFTVSPAKEIYKCFGCGRSGNTISFIMEHEKYSYVEALRWLAAKYNVEVEETAVSPEVKQQQMVADSLFILNNFARQYFSKNLFESEEGQAIGLSYLKERGFREEIMERFQLGYCLQTRDSFAQTALAAQYSIENLQKSGLVVVRDDKPLDNYRGRIIFPVHNQTGKVIGFGARIIGKSDRAPKYINTPENEVYIKSKILYGTYFARQAIDKFDECLLVEGYTDVLSLHQAGIENVVASGGTSLTMDQLRLIKKYTNNLTIIYDGDAAGVKAALRGLDMALEEGLNVKLVLIPDKEDPDSYVNKVGAASFRDFIDKNKKDFILFQLEVQMKDVGNDASKKAAVVTHVAETIAKINKLEDFTKQQDYIKKCAELLRIEEGGLVNLVNKFIREKVAKDEAKHQQQPADFGQYYEDNAMQGEAGNYSDESFNLIFKHEMQEKALLKILLEHGMTPWDHQQKIAEYIFNEAIVEEMLENQTIAKIMKMYKDMMASNQEPTDKDFIFSQENDISTLVVSLLNSPYELSERWQAEAQQFSSLEQGFRKYLNMEYKHKPLTKEEKTYKDDVISTLQHLKLKKIKHLMEQNLGDLEANNSYEKFLELLPPHLHIKEMEMEITKMTGIVFKKL
ncbi:DNA primase [Niastella populi]|uniref:DNA primase n=1 Tax=Niastella populi TaxID=550983 RepID=A0A1V9FDU7_9BACT|nr:DNA primase [Niastella populi]OQP56544.1 DNA primase [Niastella populi]